MSAPHPSIRTTTPLSPWTRRGESRSSSSDQEERLLEKQEAAGSSPAWATAQRHCRCGCGGTGRRTGPKARRAQAHVGSIPTTRTTHHRSLVLPVRPCLR